MSRSLSFLRRGLLGIAFMGALGFGATQAFGGPQDAAMETLSCEAKPWDYWTAECAQFCRPYGYSTGYCSTEGYCACGELP